MPVASVTAVVIVFSRFDSVRSRGQVRQRAAEVKLLAPATGRLDLDHDPAAALIYHGLLKTPVGK